MRIRLQNGLLLVNILAIVLIIIITFFPSNVLHIILGLPFMLVFPGYTLIIALFPRRNALHNIERVALSFGLSFVVVPLIGLILNYSPWGIRLETVLYSTATFIFITSFVAWLRRRRLPEEERFDIPSRLSLPPWGGQSPRVKFLSIGIIVAIIGALGTLGYAISTHEVGEKFTSFYVLSLEGDAIDYPTKLRVGEEARVIVGIINHEHELVNYSLEVRIDNIKNNEVEPVTLEHGEKWEQVASFVSNAVGDNQKVEFLLYRLDQDDIYRRLHLWIDVTE